MDNQTFQFVANICITIVCGGAIPFAMRVERLLAGIQATLKEREGQTKHIEDLRTRIQQLEVIIARANL